MSEVEVDPRPLFPLRRPGPLAVPADYKEWAAAAPIKRVRLRTGRDAVVVTRYEASKGVLMGEQTTASREDPRFPLMRNGVFASDNTNLVFMDGEPHHKYRRMLLPEFTPKRLAVIRPQIEAFVEASVDRLASTPQPADFHTVFSTPVPSQMICVLLGVAYEGNHEVFETATRRILSMDSTAEEFSAAAEELGELTTNLVAEQMENPGPGIIGRLITRYVRSGELSVDQLIGFANLMLIGGHETTATMMTWGMYTLLTEPGLADALRADPSLLPGAIEEMLRIHAISDLTMPKLASEDMLVDGSVIKAGEGIIPLALAANHDESVFPNPQTFDPRREGPRHLTFGTGIHACLGQNLARMELEITYSTLLRRMPSLRLAVDVDDLEIDYGSVVWALKSLPVAWDA